MLPTMGFEVDQLHTIHETLADAKVALERCLECCRARNQKFEEEFRSCFLEDSCDNEATVKLLTWTVEEMLDRLQEPGGKLWVELCDDDMNGDFANVDSMKNKLARSGQDGKEARPAMDFRAHLDGFHNSKPENVGKIRIATKTLDLERTSRYGESRLPIFLHELSHWAAGTRDVKVTSRAMGGGTGSERCYGTSKGLSNAVARGKYEDGTMRAAQNAESIGYFVAGFFDRF